MTDCNDECILGAATLMAEGGGAGSNGQGPTPPGGVNGGPAAGGPNRPTGPSRTNYIYLAIACILVGSLFWNLGRGAGLGDKPAELATSEFVAAVEANRVDEATYTVLDGTVEGAYWPEGEKKTEGNLERFSSTYVGSDALAELMAAHPKTTYKVDTEDPDMLMNLLVAILPTGLLIFVMFYFMRQMTGANNKAMQFGKTNAKTTEATRPNVKFKDVAGIDEAVEELEEVRDFLADPERFRKLGAKIPRGVLLVGPPGTGKTLLAKAVAGEANVPFFSMSGSEFVEMFVGMGASKVRDLFRQAKEKAPCIVFIDEIDAIGKKRDGQLGGNDEREQTLNQLLTEMDGFEGNTGVIILAATNRPESLDPALTRPGRFDRRVPVELPDLKGREEILKVHAKKIKIAEDVDFNKVARMASGASGAELANIVNEAALRAVRDDRRFATQADLEESIEVVIAGYQKKNAIMTDHEKKIVAYHEIGHALVAAMQTHSAPVQKITIVPRTSGALGYTMQVEEGNHYLMTKEEMENKIATLTGGRAAEEVAFGSVTTGASNDIEQATKLARAMITRYGMSDDFGMVALETVTNQYLGGDASLACSADTQTKIDQQVVELVKREHDKAVDILTANREKLDRLAAFLYEKETITGEEFMHILGE